MAFTQQTSHLYEFGHFRIDTIERVLFRDGEPVPLTPKVFDILLMLIENAGHVVEKDRLMIAIWPDSFVEEGNLTQNISLLRKALGEGENGQRCIQTIARRGYRFVAQVREVPDERDSLIVEESSKSNYVVEHEQETGIALKYAAEAEQGKEAPTASRWRALGLSIWSSISKQRLAVSGVLALALVLSISYFTIPSKPVAPVTDAHIKSIAVLPLKPMPGASPDGNVGLGITDTLINKLSNIKGIRVLPIEAVSNERLDPDPVAAGRELGMDYVLEGHYQRVDDEWRLSARLMSTKDGSAIWTNIFDEQRSNIFDLQDSLAKRVTAGLALKLTSTERVQLAKRYTESTEANDLYNTGRYHLLKHERGPAEKSIEYFEKAIKVDSEYTLAYVGLARAYLSLGRNRDKGASAVKKALELDPNLAEAHAAHSMLKQADWQWEAAETAALHALEINPNSLDARLLYAGYLATVGRLEEYMEQLKRAQELDPVSLLTSSTLGNGFYLTRAYDKAIAQQRAVLDRDLTFTTAHARLGRAYLQKGMHDQAIAEFKEAKAQDERPELSLRFALLAYAYAVSGKKGEALRMLAELKEKAKHGNTNIHSFALIYIGLGDKDRAFEWLQKACEEHTFPQFIKADSMYDSLRSDPRYPEMLQCVNLKP